jgi:hypothetical protein
MITRETRRDMLSDIKNHDKLSKQISDYSLVDTCSSEFSLCATSEILYSSVCRELEHVEKVLTDIDETSYKKLANRPHYSFSRTYKVIDHANREKAYHLMNRVCTNKDSFMNRKLEYEEYF